MRHSSQVKPISYLKAKAAKVLAHPAEQREPLLKTLALGNQEVVDGKLSPVTDVIARLRAKRAAP